MTDTALDDPYTELRHARTARRAARARAVACGLGVLLAGYLAVVFATGGPTLLSVLLTGLYLGLTAGHGYRVETRYRAEKRLYHHHPWRPADAAVVRTSATGDTCLIEVTLDRRPSWLRVTHTGRDLRAVVHRTGRIWLCGPDRRGRAIVAVDGLSAGVLALACPGPPERIELARGRATRLVPLGLGLVWLGLFGWWLATLAMRGSALGWIAGAVPLALLVWRAVLLRRRVTARRPPAAPVRGWTAAPVELDTWTPEGATAGPARGTLRLPGGVRVPVELPAASVDLVASIQAGGKLWLAAPPAPGRTLTAGVPGYRLRTTARIG